MAEFCKYDSDFGPQSPCRAFDFTVMFENSILAILPSGIFLGVQIYYVCTLLVANSQWLKKPEFSCVLILGSVLFLATLLSLVAWVIIPSASVLPVSAVHMVTAALATSLATSFLQLAFILDKSQSKSTSFIISLFTLVILLLDTARIRTFYLLGIPSRSTFFWVSFVGQYSARGLFFFSQNVSPFHINESADEAGLFSRVFIMWALPSMWRGRKGDFNIGHLPEFEYSSTDLHHKFDTIWKHELQRNPATPRLGLALIKTFYPTFLGPVFPAIVRTLTKAAQPFLVNAMISFIGSYATDEPQPGQWGWALAGMFALVFLTMAGATGLYYYYIALSSTFIRGALIEAIFRKTLLLDTSGTANSRGGQVVSLMSTDVERLTLNVEGFHRLWSSFVLVGLGLFILYDQLGIAFVAALIIVVLVAVLVPYLSKNTRLIQIRMSAFGDERIRIIAQILRQIKNIKLSGSEAELVEKVTSVRAAELQERKRFWKTFSVVVCLTSITQNLLSLFTLGTFAIISMLSRDHDTSLTTARIFTAYTVLGLIATPLLDVGQSYLGLMSAYAGLERIEKYLICPEIGPVSAIIPPNSDSLSDVQIKSDGVVDPNYSTLEKTETLSSSKEEVTSIRGAFFGWGDTVILRDITTRIRVQQLTMIIGRVGAGKSTFLASLLRETALISGEISYPWHQGHLSYCSQIPWLLKSLTIRENIIFVSSFDPIWYQEVIEACALHVDFATIRDGDSRLANGLSGGQRARIALARAVYSRHEVLVLDDPFAALDNGTAASIFSSLFGKDGLLRGKTVFLATNQISQLAHSDWIISLRDSRIAEQGPYASLLASHTPAGALLRDHVPNVQPGAITSTAILECQPEFVQRKDDAESPSKDGAEAVPIGSVSGQTYSHYWHAVGWLRMTIYGLLLVVAVGLQSGIPVYIQGWTRVIGDSHRQNTDSKKLAWYLGGYALFELGYSIAICALLYYVVMVVCQRASRNLHSLQLNALMKTPLQFFDATPTGQIISRFSQDFLNIDSQFPLAMYECGYQGMSVIASSVLMVVSVPYLAVVIFVVGVVFFFVQRFYLATSQRLRRLDLANKSPLYTLFQEVSESNGLFTIRAAAGEDHFIERNHTMLSRSQKPFYRTKITFAWLASSISLMACFVNAAIAVLAVAIRRHASTGLLAVGLSQAVSLQDIISTLLTNWTKMEISAVSVERSLAYSRLVPEEEDSTNSFVEPLDKWPSKGEVVFLDVEARYTTDGETVLKGISFRVAPASKCGIRGRTGSGKSTIFMALLRAIHIEAGSITIDGININEIPRAFLRKNITFVGQDVFILDDNVRQNINPAGNKTDNEIWAALEAVQLKSVIIACDAKLDQQLGTYFTLSQGQLQLLSLARALLAGNRIILLDEATGQLDFETEAIIQEVIRTSFHDYTVITIAHRIQTIAEYDQVVVLEHGAVIGAGRPSEF
ncbi:P-loop containing nucleoside triphosphate hydrolase protein [Mycena vulgaris]|nr:P-loop containing nucleoside triphosphate hydrolase protein [Mycena vulgaris]